MNAFKFLLAAVLIISFTAFGQQPNPGFYGKKLFVELHTASQLPIFNNLFNNRYTNDHFFNQRTDDFNTSVNGVVGIAVSSKVSVSLELGMAWASFKPVNNYIPQSYNNDYIFISHDLFDFRTITIMPKLEIANPGSNAPGGLSHQIGFGYTMSKVQDKEYDYVLTNSYADSVIDHQEMIIDYTQTYKGFTLMYAIAMRTPITKTLFFNYGLRYTANIRPASSFFVNGGEDLMMSNTDVSGAIGRTRAFSLIHLQLGFTFLL